MSDPRICEYRKDVLSEVSGDVLEIGFGTGLNLPHYPETVEQLTTVDPNPGVNSLAKRRIEASPIQVDNRVLNGESLPFADGRFDAVVSTWTLCSIAQVDLALQEIHRVLKPGGKFFFIEHGLSDESKVKVWQNRLTPVQKIIADGCHLNRNIQDLVENHFENVSVDRFYEQQFPKIIGYLYKGVAIKA